MPLQLAALCGEAKAPFGLELRSRCMARPVKVLEVIIQFDVEQKPQNRAGDAENVFAYLSFMYLAYCVIFFFSNNQVRR